MSDFGGSLCSQVTIGAETIAAISPLRSHITSVSRTVVVKRSLCETNFDQPWPLYSLSSYALVIARLSERNKLNKKHLFDQQITKECVKMDKETIPGFFFLQILTHSLERFTPVVLTLNPFKWNVISRFFRFYCSFFPSKQA